MTTMAGLYEVLTPEGTVMSEHFCWSNVPIPGHFLIHIELKAERCHMVRSAHDFFSETRKMLKVEIVDQSFQAFKLFG